MAFKLLIKKSVNALTQNTLDLGELGLRYTVDGSSNVTGGQLFVGLGSTNGTGYAAVSMVGHTHSLAAITSNASGNNFAEGDIIYASNGTSLTTLARGSNGQVLTLVSGVPAWSSAAAVNNGTLALTAGSGATNTSVSIGTGTGFSANTASNITYTVNVGPAISALATTMTGTGSGFLRKNGADTYSLDTNTYVVANSAITGATATKITFDAKGLVTSGTSLAATDIPNLDAAKITTGTFDAARIPNLDASKINAGTFDAARIPNLDAAKITTGTFSADRIPTLDLATKTSGTLAVGRGGTGATTLTANNLLVGNGTSAITAPYSVETTLTGGTAAIPRADAVKTYVDGLLAANDAMIFKGTLGTGGTYTALPTTHGVGWTIKVITAGTYAGKVAEIGDMYISLVARSGSGNTNADWAVIQSNLDGAVIGPSSATNNALAVFDQTSGKLLKNSTFVPTTIGGNLINLANPSAIRFIRINADNTASALSDVDFRTAIGAGTGNGTVTSVTGTSPVVSSGGTTPAISLAAGYGDTQNPYGTKNANVVLAGPVSGGAATPTFRALVAADIPSLDAGKITTGTLPVERGGTGATTFTNGNVLIGAGTGAITTLSRSGIDSRSTFPATAHAIASTTHTAGAFKMFASNATAVVEIDAANTSVDPFILVNTGTGSASQVPIFANTLDCGTW
jgi:hypothetical protein